MTVDEHRKLCEGSEGFLIEALDHVYWTIRCDTCGEMVKADADDARMRVAAARTEPQPVVWLSARRVWAIARRHPCPARRWLQSRSPRR
jgi:hypothetical protein